HRDLHSFPTRRSSDLAILQRPVRAGGNHQHPAVALTRDCLVPKVGLWELALYGEAALRGWGRVQSMPWNACIEARPPPTKRSFRSEEHTSELQSLAYL